MIACICFGVFELLALGGAAFFATINIVIAKLLRS